MRYWTKKNYSEYLKPYYYTIVKPSVFTIVKTILFIIYMFIRVKGGILRSYRNTLINHSFSL